MVTNWTKDMDLNLGMQLKQYFSKEERKRFPFVTVSRQFGCDGVKFADLLVEKLNEGNDGKQWFVLTRETLLEATKKEGLTEETLAMLEKFGHSDLQSWVREAIFGMGNQVETVRKMAKALRLFADRGRVVLLGGGAPVITQNMKRGLHIQFYAPLEWRIKNHAKRWSIDETEARNKVVHRMGEREAFVKTYLGVDINDPENYDFSFNNSRISAEQAVNITVLHLKSMMS